MVIVMDSSSQEICTWKLVTVPSKTIGRFLYQQSSELQILDARMLYHWKHMRGPSLRGKLRKKLTEIKIKHLSASETLTFTSWFALNFCTETSFYFH